MGQSLKAVTQLNTKPQSLLHGDIVNQWKKTAVTISSDDKKNESNTKSREDHIKLVRYTINVLLQISVITV